MTLLRSLAVTVAAILILISQTPTGIAASDPTGISDAAVSADAAKFNGEELTDAVVEAIEPGFLSWAPCVDPSTGDTVDECVVIEVSSVTSYIGTSGDENYLTLSSEACSPYGNACHASGEYTLGGITAVSSWFPTDDTHDLYIQTWTAVEGDLGEATGGTPDGYDSVELVHALDTEIVSAWGSWGYDVRTLVSDAVGNHLYTDRDQVAYSGTCEEAADAVMKKAKAHVDGVALWMTTGGYLGSVGAGILAAGTLLALSTAGAVVTISAAATAGYVVVWGVSKMVDGLVESYSTAGHSKADADKAEAILNCGGDEGSVALAGSEEGWMAGLGGGGGSFWMGSYEEPISCTGILTEVVYDMAGECEERDYRCDIDTCICEDEPFEVRECS